MWKTLRDFRDAIAWINDACGTRNTLILVAINLLAVVLAVPVLLVYFPFWVLGRGYCWTSNFLRGVGTRRDDPVFGRIVYAGHSVWLANHAIDALGGSFEISVSGPRKTGPESSQHALFQGIIEHQHELRRQVEESLFLEYQTAAEEWRKEMYEVLPDFAAMNRDLMPDLQMASQIWPRLSDGCIQLEDQPGCFTIQWGCEWILEYGATSATFVNWKLQDIDDD